MWEDTGRLAMIWLRITLALAVLLGVTWLLYGWHSTPFAAAAVIGALVQYWAVRGLAREWSWLARGNWWWG